MRSHYCGKVTEELVDQEVTLCGWVNRRRDHGGVIFIDLRDREGLVQVVFDPIVNKKSCEIASLLREEYVVKVKGKVALRVKGTENPYLETGRIEVFAHGLEILSRSKALPFQITEKAMVFGEEIQAGPEIVDEELRLRHRYLDLRRPSMQEILIKRYRIIQCIREYLDSMNFAEVEK